MKKQIFFFLILTLLFGINVYSQQFREEKILALGHNDDSKMIKSDIDADGLEDIVIGDVGLITWHKNLGNGKFSEANIIGFCQTSVGALKYNQLFSKDLNNDNKQDVIFICGGNSSSYDLLGYFLNLGNGMFSSQINISTSLSNGKSVFSTDLDNDGKNDIVANANYGNKLVWFKNLGTGFSSERIIDNSTLYPDRIYCTDIDGDGDQDIVSSTKSLSWGNDKLILYENQNAGNNFVSKILKNNVQQIYTIMDADFNTDGKKDILIADNRNLILVENTGSNNFIENILYASNNNSIYDILLTDFDSDNDSDIIIRKMSDILLFENTSGTFGSGSNLASLSGAGYLLSIDANSDGKKDIIYNNKNQNADPNLKMMLNNGNGFSSGFETGSTVASPVEILTADMDGDGKLDIISLSNMKIAWYQNLSNGSFSTQNIIIDSLWVYSMAKIDYNNDSKIDILYVGYNSGVTKLHVLENSGAGIFIDHPIAAIVNDPEKIFLNDVDNDGDSDVFYIGRLQQNNLYFSENLGNLSFVNSVLIDNQMHTKQVKLEDMDGDAKKDVVFADYYPNLSIKPDKIIWIKNNNNSFSGRQILIDSINWDNSILMEIKDIDGDSKKDIVTAEDNLKWYKNNGNNTFSAAQTIHNDNVFTYNPSFVVCDYDLDGDMDIINNKGVSPTNQLFLHINKGAGQFMPPSSISTNRGLQGSCIEASNVDNNQKLDLIIAQPQRDKISFFLNCGTSSVINATSCNSYLSPAGYQYTVSGTYNDTISNLSGCDSIITINLTINNVNVNTSVTQNGATLTSNANSATYQWLDCNNNLPISGQTSQNYTVTSNGNYAVIVSQNGCSDTSSCYLVSSVGVSENTFDNLFVVYPNPTSSGKFTFEIKQNVTQIIISNIVGKQIVQKQITQNKSEIDLSSFENGMYLLNVILENKETKTIKIIKQ